MEGSRTVGAGLELDNFILYSICCLQNYQAARGWLLAVAPHGTGSSPFLDINIFGY